MVADAAARRPASRSVSTAAPALDTLAFRGGDLVVRRAGQGRPIGYLHGLIGPAPAFVDALAAVDRAVVAPCLPGFTGSAPCDDLRSLHDWVVATSEVLDLTGMAGGPVVASSTGAMLALEVACIRPEAFSSLVVLAPLGLWDADDPIADPFARSLTDQRALLTADPGRTAGFFDDVAATPADVVEQGVARYRTRTAAASLVWPFPEFGITTRLHRVACPVTIVWGGADAVCGPAYLERWRAALPDVAATHVVPGAGHLVEWDDPEAVAALV